MSKRKANDPNNSNSNVEALVQGFTEKILELADSIKKNPNQASMKVGCLSLSYLLPAATCCLLPLLPPAVCCHCCLAGRRGRGQTSLCCKKCACVCSMGCEATNCTHALCDLSGCVVTGVWCWVLLLCTPLTTTSPPILHFVDTDGSDGRPQEEGLGRERCLGRPCP